MALNSSNTDVYNQDMPTLMARQPIFDRHKRTIAYELLHREANPLATVARLSDEQATSATQQVWLNAFTSINKQGKKKTLPAFINITEEILLAQTWPTVPCSDVVFELPASLATTPEVAKALKTLKAEGYRTLLDGCTLSSKSLALLPAMSMVKFDVNHLTEAELSKCIKIAEKNRVLPIAIKIETNETLEACIRHGFKLFQGFVLSKPKIVTGSQLSANQGSLIQLLAQVQDPNVAPETLEKLIIQDPALTYHFLRIVNSAAYSLVRKVESVEEAVVLLGLEQVKRWTTLLSVSKNPSIPDEVTRALLVRSAMCEQIAKQSKAPEPSKYFMVGMVSGLHNMLAIEQRVLLENLPISDSVKDAVTAYVGELGEVLSHVQAYETGQWQALPNETDFKLYELAYRNAIEWSESAMQAITSH